MSTGTAMVPLTVAIPTYRRERVLLDTLRHLSGLAERPREILVVDQTLQHEPETQEELERLHQSGTIRWLVLREPSIPKAMNLALLESREEIVLFLDDDIRPEPELLAAHCAAHEFHPGALIAGRVIQPWEEGKADGTSCGFHFNSLEARWIEEFMGGNFSIRKSQAIALGGFDENFVRVAYRFEAEFANRLCSSGARIRYEPRACIHHLKVVEGGTRSYGDHLTTWRPHHAVGGYYFSLRTADYLGFSGRPLRSIATRYHLSHPWRVFPTLLSELFGMFWAVLLYARGPRYVQPPAKGQNP
jgi:GT2 family glycosyltransferase